MKVRELITKLEGFDPESEVILFDPHHDTFRIEPVVAVYENDYLLQPDGTFAWDNQAVEGSTPVRAVEFEAGGTHVRAEKQERERVRAQRRRASEESPILDDLLKD